MFCSFPAGGMTANQKARGSLIGHGAVSVSNDELTLIEMQCGLSISCKGFDSSLFNQGLEMKSMKITSEMIHMFSDDRSVV
jgi:hypothetical protein